MKYTEIWNHDYIKTGNASMFTYLIVDPHNIFACKHLRFCMQITHAYEANACKFCMPDLVHNLHAVAQVLACKNLVGMLLKILLVSHKM